MKIRLIKEVFLKLHTQIISHFKTNHQNPPNQDYQLYGYNNYKKSEPNLKEDIIRKYIKKGQKEKLLQEFGADDLGNVKFNGKYLRDALHMRIDDKKEYIDFNAAYLSAYLFYLGFANLESFIGFLRKEKKITLQDQLRQMKQLNKSMPLIKKTKFKCYFYDSKERQIISFDLFIQGEDAWVDNAPSGRSYKGKMVDEENRRLKLTASDAKYQVSSLHIIFKGQDPNWNEYNLSVGYFACFSDLDSCIGAMILEKEIKFEDSSIQLAKNNIDPLQKKETLLEKLMLNESEITKKYLRDRINFLTELTLNRIFSLPQIDNAEIKKEKVMEKIDEDKLKFYRLYLKDKHANINHREFYTFKDLTSNINYNFPQWENDYEIVDTISGYYIAFIAINEKKPRSSKRIKKLEQVLFHISEDGKVLCRSINSGRYNGRIDINRQQVALIQMRGVSNIPAYQLVLEIPENISQIKEDKKNLDERTLPIILKGVFSGFGKECDPSAGKVYLHSISSEEFDLSENQPSYFFMDKPEGIAKIKLITNKYGELNKYFSLLAEDDYLCNSEIFFGNFIPLEKNDSDISPFAGVYNVLRASTSSRDDSLKMFPLQIYEDGQLSLKHKYFEISGKALLYGKRLIMHFFGNGLTKYDYSIIVPLFNDKVSKSNVLNGILTSTSINIEPFSCEVILNKCGKDVDMKDLNYKKLYLNSDDFKNLNNSLGTGYKNLGYYLLNKKFSSITRIFKEELNSIFQNRQNESVNFLRNEKYAIKECIDSLINFYFTKNLNSKKKAKVLAMSFSNNLDKLQAVLRSYDKLNDKQRSEIKDIFEEFKSRSLSPHSNFYNS